MNLHIKKLWIEQLMRRNDDPPLYWKPLKDLYVKNGGYPTDPDQSVYRWAGLVGNEVMLSVFFLQRRKKDKKSMINWIEENL